jgi:hypothetical protein
VYGHPDFDKASGKLGKRALKRVRLLSAKAKNRVRPANAVPGRASLSAVTDAGCPRVQRAPC